MTANATPEWRSLSRRQKQIIVASIVAFCISIIGLFVLAGEAGVLSDLVERDGFPGAEERGLDDEDEIQPPAFGGAHAPFGRCDDDAISSGHASTPCA